ncbi:MAG: hypothetical protein LIO90_00610 [Bacteroidales bacterium]|nr:hypothetical protein [Bacteroidales bacterium]
MCKDYIIAVAFALLLGISAYARFRNPAQEPVDSEELIENLEALSNTEWLFTTACMGVVSESSSVFELAFIVRKCLPCGEIVWATWADFPGNCENNLAQ